ncbi:PaaI family thioesterase [Pseudoruegeria sp. SHC-113]|uniref:PaaI family thioesterase n=1 Tax=Pseudoruegeria sp. SHC-113 TaxID=2855439 RepID=UPI0021BA60E2|nr:PaaI family thioesterase [Pseudoruegeria sp. SHC-113]MCT8160973.1 PaaI family thioesterase [Pseudoruegeria sp. SHC-113]
MEARIRESFARQGLMRSFAAEVVSVAEGAVEIRAPITPEVGQQQGFAHAGLTFALGDSAAGYAALTRLPDGQEVVTAEMKINLLAPAIGTHLIARGRVVKPGRRLVVVVAEVFAVQDSGEKPVALLQGTMVPVGA